MVPQIILFCRAVVFNLFVGDPHLRKLVIKWIPQAGLLVRVPVSLPSLCTALYHKQPTHQAQRPNLPFLWLVFLLQADWCARTSAGSMSAPLLLAAWRSSSCSVHSNDSGLAESLWGLQLLPPRDGPGSCTHRVGPTRVRSCPIAVSAVRGSACSTPAKDGDKDACR